MINVTKTVALATVGAVNSEELILVVIHNSAEVYNSDFWPYK
jgi:hypothetical protein